MKIESLENRQLLAGAGDELAQCKADLAVAKQTIEELHCDCDNAEPGVVSKVFSTAWAYSVGPVYNHAIAPVAAHTVVPVVNKLVEGGSYAADKASDKWGRVGLADGALIAANVAGSFVSAKTGWMMPHDSKFKIGASVATGVAGAFMTAAASTFVGQLLLKMSLDQVMEDIAIGQSLGATAFFGTQLPGATATAKWGATKTLGAAGFTFQQFAKFNEWMASQTGGMKDKLGDPVSSSASDMTKKAATLITGGDTSDDDTLSNH